MRFRAVTGEIRRQVIDRGLDEIADWHPVLPIAVVAVPGLAAAFVAEFVDAGYAEECVPRHPVKSTFANAVVALRSGAVLSLCCCGLLEIDVLNFNGCHAELILDFVSVDGQQLHFPGLRIDLSFKRQLVAPAGELRSRFLRETEFPSSVKLIAVVHVRVQLRLDSLRHDFALLVWAEFADVEPAARTLSP